MPCATRNAWPALGLITPSFDPDVPLSEPVLAGWDALARGLREDGVEGFVDAYDFSEVPAQWRDTVEKSCANGSQVTSIPRR